MADHPAPQLSRADLAGMPPEDIATAGQEGRLDALLGRTPAPDLAKPHLDRDDLRHMTPQQVVEARENGQLIGLGIYPTNRR